MMVLGWVLDTDVLSELKRPRRSPAVARWLLAQPEHTLFVSQVTVAEIRIGIELLAEDHQREALSRWLADEVRALFSGRVLEVTEDILVAWRRQIRAARRAGRGPAEVDALIAATALVRGRGVATRNVRDFGEAGVSPINPRDPA